MAFSKPVKDPLYVNFLSVGLGLQHLQQGLVDFVQSKIEDYHDDLVIKTATELNSTLPIDCSRQTFFTRNSNNVPKYECRSCTSGSSDKGRCDKNCQNIVCNTIANQITSQHRTKKPSWKNSDPSLWTSNPWEVTKCFLPPVGYSNATSAKDTDATGLLNIIIYMKNIRHILGIPDKDFKAQTDVFSKCKEIRNAIQHSPKQELGNTHKTEFLNKIEAVLNIIPVSNGTTTALTNISDIKKGKLPSLTEEIIDVILSGVTKKMKTKLKTETLLGLDTIKEATKTETKKGLDTIKEAAKKETQQGLDTIKEATKKETQQGLVAIKEVTKKETQQGLDTIKEATKTETKQGLDRYHKRGNQNRTHRISA